MTDLKISQFVDGDKVQPTDEIATNRAGVNTKVYVGTAAGLDVGTGDDDIPQNSNLGTAAYLDTGESTGDVVVLESVGGSPGLPAVDGSQLTNLPVSPLVGATSTDTTPGFLNEKLNVDNSLVIDEIGTGDESLEISVRREFAPGVSKGSGTHVVDIDDGDFHQVTATGVFTLEASMQNGQAVMVRAIDFGDWGVNVSFFDFGDAGTPVWTGKDDFIIYRDIDGNYIAKLVVSGLS